MGLKSSLADILIGVVRPHWILVALHRNVIILWPLNDSAQSEDIHQDRLYNLLPSAAIGTDAYCRRSLRPPVCLFVRPSVRLERCSCSNLIKISAINLKFGGMIYSTMEYMASLNGFDRPIFA